MVEVGDNPADMEEKDRIRIDHEGVSGVEMDVVDVEVEDIGITEVVVVTLLSDGGEQYVMKWAAHSNGVEVTHVRSEESVEVSLNDIVALE